MTIDEAIKLIAILQGETPEQLATPVQQAINLGIEALKRIKRERFEVGSEHYVRLSGETEE